MSENTLLILVCALGAALIIETIVLVRDMILRRSIRSYFEGIRGQVRGYFLMELSNLRKEVCNDVRTELHATRDLIRSSLDEKPSRAEIEALVQKQLAELRQEVGSDTRVEHKGTKEFTERLVRESLEAQFERYKSTFPGGNVAKAA